MENVPSIRIVRSAVPEEVEDAIFAAMAKTPADRPQTAAKFAEFLARADGLDGDPSSGVASHREAAGFNVRACRPLRRPTPITRSRALETPPILAAAVGVLALAGFGAWRLAGHKPTPSASLDPAIKRSRCCISPTTAPITISAGGPTGLTEALIKALGQVRTLSVVSGTASNRSGHDVAPTA